MKGIQIIWHIYGSTGVSSGPPLAFTTVAGSSEIGEIQTQVMIRCRSCLLLGVAPAAVSANTKKPFPLLNCFLTD